ACVGIVAAATILPSRPTVWLIAAIALQAAALFVVAARSGADRPYLALKMVYLSVYPLAVACAVTLDVATRLPRVPRLSRPLIVVVLALIVGRGLTREPRRQPAVSTPMYLAGR